MRDQIIGKLEKNFQRKQIASYMKMKTMVLMMQEEISLLETKEAELRFPSGLEILAMDLNGVGACGVM